MRVKRGLAAHKRHKRILKKTKGYSYGRRKVIRRAKEALLKAGTHAYTSRRLKKRDIRALWNIRINAGVRAHGINYSTFIAALKKNNSILDRKVLSTIAKDYPNAFKAIVEQVKK